MELILGSQSPRRREILSYFCLPFKQVTPNFDEESIEFQGDPITYAHILSKGKADSLFPHYPHDLILTADTIVYRQGKIYGKPQNEQEAFQTFKELVDKWHQVYTSLTLRQGQREFQAIEETKVLFNSLTDEEIHTYYRKLPYIDKAGGYTIQGAGSLIVNRIEGAYDNVMGLPLNTLRQLLIKVGIDLWNYLK